MKKKSKILLIIIIIIILLMGILYLISSVRGQSITGDSISLLSQKESVNKQLLNPVISEIIGGINKEEKYLQFIRSSGYDSVELIIDKKSYYFAYDLGLNKVIETNPQKCDFTMEINAREFNKAFKLYEEADYNGAVLKVSNEIPREVKLKLFKQCMRTEWCKQGNF